MKGTTARNKIKRTGYIFKEGMNKVTPAIRSNKTKIRLSASMVGVNCGHCGMAFEKYACHAKRVANHYCSQSCAGEAKKIPIYKSCAICGTKIVCAPASYSKFTTCSAIECVTERKRIQVLARGGLHSHKAQPIGGYTPKISQEIANKIKAASGTQAEIAKAFGVSQPSVSFIKTGKPWSRKP